MALVAVFTIHGIDHLHRGLHFESSYLSSGAFSLYS